jgi:hypothetical protein
MAVTKKDVKRRAWHYAKPALMILLSLPVLYVLSVGPLVFVIRRIETKTLNKHKAAMDVLNAIYSPIVEPALESRSVGGKLMRSYLSLWAPSGVFPEPPE